MNYYVGNLVEPRSAAGIGATGEDLDGMVTAIGFHMDDGRKVRFRARRETLEAYFADPDEDAYIDVQDEDVIKVSGRPGRDLWSNAGLPWSIG